MAYILKSLPKEILGLPVVNIRDCSCGIVILADPNNLGFTILGNSKMNYSSSKDFRLIINKDDKEDKIFTIDIKGSLNSIDKSNVSFIRDLFELKAVPNNPNIYKICAELASEKHPQSKVTSTGVGSEEQTESEDSIEGTSSMDMQMTSTGLRYRFESPTRLTLNPSEFPTVSTTSQSLNPQSARGTSELEMELFERARLRLMEMSPTPSSQTIESSSTTERPQFEPQPRRTSTHFPFIDEGFGYSRIEAPENSTDGE